MLNLFEHNRIAYESAVEMLAECGKAAIVHPTGTGKSFIGFKLCEDNPDSEVLWLSPSEYIFSTQLENLRSAGSEPPQNVRFYTYAKLMQLSEDELACLHPDYIILDEFHRAGSTCWQINVQRLIELNPEAKLLGLSATNIRYLDNQRDMAEELFDGCIASEMTLGEAIVRGILPAPKYVTSVYSMSDELERLESKLRHNVNSATRDKAERILDELRHAIEHADGLDTIFEKHMTDRHGKYIVFTANAEAMRECVSHVGEWFAKLDTKPHVYTLYSGDPSTSREFDEFKRDADDSHLRLLFCIDALNEGIHVDDVAGVILFRPTISPIVYKQQIGRALSASKRREPVIFDIVNNFENLYSIGAIEEEMRAAITYYNYLGDGQKIVNERFKVVDEVRDCLRLFDELEDTLTTSWDTMFDVAKQYYLANSNLNVPVKYKTADGYNLGAWLSTQRKIRAGKQLGRLGESRIAKLDSIGMRWESVNDVSWNKYYNAYKSYVENGGSLLVPNDYVADGVELGRWLAMIRTYRNSGIKTSYFTKEREQALEKIGIIWSQPDYLWERNYAAAVKFHREHGHLEVPAGYVQDGVKLYSWLASLRKAYRESKNRESSITAEQIERMNKLGMRWGSKADEVWDGYYKEAKDYAKQHGSIDVPVNYVTNTGCKLGIWISKNREKYAKGTLSEDKIEKLNAINMVWSKVRVNSWDECYKLVKEYYKRNGSLDMPPDYVDNGVWLGKWLNEQRQIYLGNRPGKSLTSEQVEKLRGIGFTFETKNDQRWRENYLSLKRYLESSGSRKLPTGYRSESGENLYIWLRNQRIWAKQGKVSDEKVKLLRAIGCM